MAEHQNNTQRIGLMQAVVNASAVGMAICDADGALIHANAAAGPLFGPDRPEHEIRSLLSAMLADREGELPSNRDSTSDLRYKFTVSPVDLDGRKGAVVTIEDISHRTRAETAYSRICNMATEMICVADLEKATFIRVNPAFERVLGFTREELLGRPFLDFIHPADVDPTVAVIQNKLRQGIHLISFENRYRCKDGSYRWLEWNSHPIPEENLTYAIARDITLFRETETALREERRALQEAQRVAKIGSWEFDPATGRPTWSDQMYAIFGLNPEDGPPPYKSHREFIHPEDWDRFDAAVTRAVKTGAGYVVEIRIFRSDGEVRTVSARCVAETDADGTVVRLIGTTQDVTDRKQAEEKLRESELKYRTIFENAPLGLFRSTPEGRFIEVNPALAEMLGYDDPREVLREIHSIADQVYIQREQRPAIVDRQLKTHGITRHFNRYRRRDGSEFVANLYLRTIRDPAGQPLYLEGIVEDITEQIRLNEEKNRLEAQFHQAQKLESVGRLAGGVAHDLNNLLAPVLGYGEMLLEDFSGEDVRRSSVTAMLEAGRRARDLVRQLLAFSRKQVLAVKPVNLNAILTRFEPLLRRTIREDVAIIVQPASNLPLVRADTGQLEQVLMNLAVNAQDAMEDGGTLTIETAAVDLDERYASAHESVTPGEYVLLAVSDTGRGMDEPTRDQVFEPFFTTKENEKGTGLGLATVYGIVKQHGGSIRVYSEPGRGATFKVYLPVCEGTHSPAPPDEADRENPRGAETVLLAEDNEGVRKLTRTILARQGYHVLMAESGRSALALLAQYEGPVHLLLTDVVMPDMNGRELYDRVSRQYPQIKVLFMSGYTDNVIAHRGVIDEGVHFIQKPFSVGGLAAKLREVLDGES